MSCKPLYSVTIESRARYVTLQYQVLGESVSYDGSRDLSSSPFVCVMDVYYICVGPVLVMVGVRIFIILNIVLCIL